MTDHTVKAYDAELKKLSDTITHMAELTKSQFKRSMKCIEDWDFESAEQIVAEDDIIDDIENDLYDFAVRMLALRQPMAGDLRNIIAALKISTDIERIADYAANAAKRAVLMKKASKIDLAGLIPELGTLALQMFESVIEAFLDKDMEKAVAVWQSDNVLDQKYTDAYLQLIRHMEKNKKDIAVCTQLLFIAKSIERTGDHTTNIAETIYYSIRGKTLTSERAAKLDIEDNII